MKQDLIKQAVITKLSSMARAMAKGYGSAAGKAASKKVAEKAAPEFSRGALRLLRPHGITPEIALRGGAMHSLRGGFLGRGGRMTRGQQLRLAQQMGRYDPAIANALMRGAPMSRFVKYPLLGGLAGAGTLYAGTRMIEGPDTQYLQPYGGQPVAI